MNVLGRHTWLLFCWQHPLQNSLRPLPRGVHKNRQWFRWRCHPTWRFSPLAMGWTSIHRASYHCFMTAWIVRVRKVCCLASKRDGCCCAGDAILSCQNHTCMRACECRVRWLVCCRALMTLTEVDAEAETHSHPDCRDVEFQAAWSQWKSMQPVAAVRR